MRLGGWESLDMVEVYEEREVRGESKALYED
jgi:hypothetical protein